MAHTKRQITQTGGKTDRTDQGTNLTIKRGGTGAQPNQMGILYFAREREAHVATIRKYQYFQTKKLAKSMRTWYPTTAPPTPAIQGFPHPTKYTRTVFHVFLPSSRFFCHRNIGEQNKADSSHQIPQPSHCHLATVHHQRSYVVPSKYHAFTTPPLRAPRIIYPNKNVF